ncbi:MAG: ABC transporter permease [Silanimonas sp.]
MNASPTFDLRHLLRMQAIETGHALLQVWRLPAFSIPTLAFPLLFYATFGLLLPSETGNDAPAHYLLATYGAFAVIGPALFGFGVGMAIDEDMGWLRLKRVSPMPMGVHFVGRVLTSMVFALAVVLALSALAAFVGKVRLSAAQWLLLWSALTLGALPFCAMGLWVGSLVKARAAVAVVNLIYLPMAVLSGLWFPIMLFPEPLQRFALVLPAYHLGELALTIVGIRDANVAASVVVLMGFGALFLALALRAQRQRR